MKQCHIRLDTLCDQRVMLVDMIGDRIHKCTAFFSGPLRRTSKNTDEIDVSVHFGANAIHRHIEVFAIKSDIFQFTPSLSYRVQERKRRAIHRRDDRISAANELCSLLRSHKFLFIFLL